MRFVFPLFITVTLGLGACTVDSIDSETESDTTYTTQASECADEAETCVTDCFADNGIDVGALEMCAQDIQDCLAANPGDPAACQAIAEACLGQDVVTATEDLVGCLDTCSTDFGDCVPDAPELPDPSDIEDAVECFSDHAECLGTCAGGLGGCELPGVECEPNSFGDLADCIDAAAGDVAAITQCFEDLSGACVVTEPDLGCFEDGAACFETCGEALDTCLSS